ncbi:MAG: hypothetical protein EXR65_02875 [Dehalococcoidia bacterium]|nr:hypothetical protein [Dehalococcoidia bacterium]
MAGATATAVNVRGTIEVLQGLEAILRTPIAVSGAGEGQVTQEATLQPPAGARPTGRLTAMVVVPIGPINGTLQLSVAPTATGVPRGLTARFSQSRVTVTLQGPLPKLNALNTDAVRVTVDVSGLVLRRRSCNRS